MSETPIFIADAFIGTLGPRLLRGNPAAVAILPAPREASWMQEVAAEMNLSETAFLVQKDAQNFDLRWFTPQCEVELCGHATLASAHVLWETGRLDASKTAYFSTQSGVLSAQKRGELVALDFPAQLVEFARVPPDLVRALGLPALGDACTWRAKDDLFIELPSGSVEKLQPDFALLGAVSSAAAWRGVIVTEPAPEAASFDFISRFFAPGVGIDEDPVTGSAHTKLAPFWGARLGKTKLTGFQASARGGLVEVNWQGERVELLGRASTRVRGALLF